MRKTTQRKALACAVGLLASFPFTAARAQTGVSPAEARAIAKEAYIYGYPMVDSYRIEYGYFVSRQDPEYKGPWNQIHNEPRVYTPADRAIQTPNSDTPYSWLGLDLRAEPIVLTLPAIEKERYFSVQLIDLYTFNFDYLGSRATGNDGGSFLIAGPAWQGETPRGIKKVIRSETELILAVYRTQLFDPGDIDNMKKVQAGYQVQTLSAFLGTTAPKAAPAIDFIKPLTHAEEKTSLQLFNILNFLLQFCPTDPSETELMARFARIGVGAGKTFDPAATDPRSEDGHRAGHRRCLGCLCRRRETAGQREADLRRCLRHARIHEEQLPVSHAGDHRHLGQLQAGGDVSGLSRRFRWAEARGVQPLPPALRAGPAAACQRVLVADDV